MLEVGGNKDRWEGGGALFLRFEATLGLLGLWDLLSSKIHNSSFITQN